MMNPPWILAPSIGHKRPIRGIWPLNIASFSNKLLGPRPKRILKIVKGCALRGRRKWKEKIPARCHGHQEPHPCLSPIHHCHCHHHCLDVSPFMLMCLG